VLGTLAALCAIVAASCTVGLAIWRACRLRAGRALAPVVGFAALVAVAPVLLRLPGHATTAAVLLAAIAIAAGVWCRAELLAGVRRADAAATAAIAALATLIPFVSSGRFGALGMSFNDDMAVHLRAAEYLKATGHAPPYGFNSGYPTGPHSLVAVVAKGVGTGADAAFNGLSMAVPVLVAVAALSLARELAPWRRVLIALLPALAYLPITYYAEGAFKETMLAAFTLTFALVVRDLAAAGRVRAAGLVPLAVLAAGAVATYSYPGVVWPAGTLALTVAAYAVAGGYVRHPRRALAAVRGVLPALGAAVAILVVLLAPALPRLVNLFHSLSLSPAGTGAIAKNNLGNLAGQLRVFEAFGIWPTDDFRFVPPDRFHAGLLAAVAVGAAGFGLLWFVRRRDFALPAAVLFAAGVFAVVRHTQSPYVAAKALVILSPLVVAVAGRALIAPIGDVPAEVRFAKLATAIVFVGGVAWSSFLTLRSAYVGPPAHQNQLISLRPLVKGTPVLFLGDDYYIGWRLFDATVTAPPDEAPIPFTLRGQKSSAPGEPLDFDSVDAATLNRYEFVITTRTAYASTPPPNFRRVAVTADYEVWRRTGPTPDHSILNEGSAPGAILDCATPAGRHLSRERGTAVVLPTPVLRRGPAAVPAGARYTVGLRLPAGRYSLSLQYTSPQDVRLSAPGLKQSLAASLDRRGAMWPAGTLVVPRSGSVPVTFSVPRRPPLGSRSQIATFGLVAAVPGDGTPQRVPLRRACGRYVDWYRLGAPAASREPVG
jgi:hypothetical protein